jgi:hypothetical protein
MRATKSAGYLLAGIRANVQIIRGDLRDLRHDLATDWRYLRADLRDDRTDLADGLRADLAAWRQRLPRGTQDNASATVTTGPVITHQARP